MRVEEGTNPRACMLGRLSLLVFRYLRRSRYKKIARPLRGLAIFLCANVKLSLKEEVMDLSFFVRGLLIGFSIAATVGPMCILCMQRTLYKGQIYGLVSGLGIATADAVYGSIAAFGLTLITNFLVNQQGWVRLIGGLFLFYLGLKTVITKPAERAATAKANGYFGAYASTFLLTLPNPLPHLPFPPIFPRLQVCSP